MTTKDKDPKSGFDFWRLLIYIFIAAIGATPLTFRYAYRYYNLLIGIVLWLLLESLFVWLLYLADNGRRY